MTPEQQLAIRTTRSMLDLGYGINQILESGLISGDLKEFVRSQIAREQNIILSPAGVISSDHERFDWLQELDRSEWYYWPTLRQYLLTTKGWDSSVVRSLDDSSDRILRQLCSPSIEKFDIRGLVLGFVQSGKTANFTAVIAKAADAGYRFVIVLSGMEKGLRLQTNRRLKRELVGYSDGRSGAVKLPPIGRQWHEFTRDDLDGDFQAGFANHAALQGSQPVLLVVKKNGPVLRRLMRWLDEAPSTVRRALPTIVIDDEADQASVDTRGSYQTEAESDGDIEEPAVINGLIRELLCRFDKSVYVAYTATPFANILIPHDSFYPGLGSDLYPKDFIIDLPKPPGYTGAEELFGRMDVSAEGAVTGLDVVRHVFDEDLVRLENGELPCSLETALIDFVLAGAGRSLRGQDSCPATMLIHTSHLNLDQSRLRQEVSVKFAELRDEWRYQRKHGIRERLKQRWEQDFRTVTRCFSSSLDVSFDKLDPFIGPFFEAVQIREINSSVGEVLDYEEEPSLKAIAIGGNKLSRGLTVEGLVVSYFVRRSVMYDTLMQMGRWFGYREGYEDLTRIYTTPELHAWFSDLSFVEHRLREDIHIYEDQGCTPLQLGMRIWQHPAMQVTSPLKRRFATSTVISQSYSLSVEQTFKFPFSRMDDLASQADANLNVVRGFLSGLGSISESYKRYCPVWKGVPARKVLEFLGSFNVDPGLGIMSMPLIVAYVQRMLDAGELRDWIVGVCPLKSVNKVLGSVDWGLECGPIAQIGRSRIRNTESLGVITGSGDELLGLSDPLVARAEQLVEEANAAGRKMAINRAAREVRSSEHGLKEGLLLLYPISRLSGYDAKPGGVRCSLYEEPRSPLARDLIGMAISFPKAEQDQAVEAFVEGTAGWRPIE
jgi:hypothetical protein